LALRRAAALSRASWLGSAGFALVRAIVAALTVLGKWRHHGAGRIYFFRDTSTKTKSQHLFYGFVKINIFNLSVKSAIVHIVARVAPENSLNKSCHFTLWFKNPSSRISQMKKRDKMPDLA